MSAPGQRRSYLPRAAFGRPQQAPESIGAKRDAYGNLIPTGPQASTQAPPNDGSLSAPHDWSAFNGAFPKSNSAAKDRIGPVQPQSQDFTQLPVGGSRVIPNEPGKGAPTINPNTPIQSQAMEIDPRYRTPGASPVARITTGTPATGPGRIVDETGDRTADFTAGGRLSSAPMPAPKPMSLTADQAKALNQAYPNLRDGNHPDSVAFRNAFQQSFDPNKPMSTDDVLGIAHGLFQQRDMAKNGATITNTNFGTPNLAQSQHPLQVGSATIGKPNIPPYQPEPFSTGNVSMNGAQPQTQVGGIAFNQPQMPSNVTGTGVNSMAGPIKPSQPAAPQPGLIDKAIDTVKSWMPTPAPTAQTDADKQKLLTQPLGTFGF